MLTVLNVLAFLLIILSVWWWRKRKPIRDCAAQLPGLPAYPLVGSVHLFVKTDVNEIYSTITKLTTCFKDNFKLWFGTVLVVVVRDADDLRTILSSEECFDKMDFLYKMTFEHGLIVLNGETYKLHRKTVAPVLSPAKLKSFFPIIKQKMNNFMELFESSLDPLKEIDFSSYSLDFALETLLSTMFSEDNVTKDERLKFIHAMETRMVLLSTRLLKMYFWSDLIFKFSKLNVIYQKCRRDLDLMASFLMKNFESDYEQKTKTTDRNSSLFLTQLYTLRDSMSLLETRESISTFLITGCETSGKTISSVLLLLAMHTDAQEKVFHELSSILTSDGQGFTEEDLGQMEYLDMVIKEALRLIPVALAIGRSVKKDLKLKNFVLPRNAATAILIRDLHTDKRYWGDDADDFKPERFSKENFKNVNRNAYMPFSRGPRMCPGYRYAWMTMQIFLSNFLMRYKVTTDVKFDDLEYHFYGSTSISPGCLMKVQRR